MTQTTEIKVPTLTATYKGFNTTNNQNMNNMHDWVVTLRYEGRKMQTQFHMGSARHEEPTLYDVLNSLFMDASCANSASDTKDFADSLGYDDIKEATNIYKACQRIEKSLMRLFDTDEQGLADLHALYSENEIID